MLGSSVWTRGNYWWRWIGGGSSGCDEWHWIAAATELAGDEEEGTFSDDCWLREHYGGGLGLPECSQEHGASFYSTTGLAPRRWIRSTTIRRCCSCRASWRRRARADEHVDRLGLFPGGSWRARVAWAAPSTAEPAADAGVPPRALTAALWAPGEGLEGSGERMRTGAAL